MLFSLFYVSHRHAMQPALELGVSCCNYSFHNCVTRGYCLDKPADDTRLKTLPLQHYLALILGSACIAFQALDLVDVLQFNRQAIIQGQWWRLLSCNLVHLGIPHLLLNLAGLAVITLLVGHALTALQWLIVTLLCMLSVGLGLYWFDLQLNWYVGLSGCLYGLLIAGAVAEFSSNRLIATILIGYTLGKVIHEQYYGASHSSEMITGGKVIVNAHLYGTLAGLSSTIVLLLLARLRRRQ